MLSIGEFSNICRVTTKTLRYYAEIGLLLPKEINLENGYRYYSIDQLEIMLFITRLKAYHFSLEEIKTILMTKDLNEEQLYDKLEKKKAELERYIQNTLEILSQLNKDMENIKGGNFMKNDMNISLVEMPTMHLLSIRKYITKEAFSTECPICFEKLFNKLKEEHLTMSASPMCIYYNSEYTVDGLDTEIAIPIKEWVTGTKDFTPGLCLKTVVKGSYLNLSTAYAHLLEYANQEGYIGTNGLFDVYVTDPNQVTSEDDQITEVYFPVKKAK